jgi:hypothetical protein
MVRKLTQRERKERGGYCEALTQRVLEEEGFTIIKKFEGGETRAEKGTIGSCPDLVIKRPNSEKLYRIEVKSGQTHEIDSGRKVDPLLGVAPERTGRIQLAAGKTKRTGVAKKDCYAVSLDDAYANARTVEFFDPDYLDKWMREDIKDPTRMNSSKFPLSFYRHMRENSPCPINELKAKTWIFKDGEELRKC